MWIYHQTTGLLVRNGLTVCTGYSGYGKSKNYPADQQLHNLGPCPQGFYTIGPPEALEGGPHGPYVLPLTPDPANEMFGRSGFLMHSDSISHPGFASAGCIIIPTPVRRAIVASGDNRLQVVP